jgi:hypothetical protein
MVKNPIRKDILQQMELKLPQRGSASLKERHNSVRLFELNSICSKFFVLSSVSSFLTRSISSIQFISERKELRTHGLALIPSR